MCVCDRSHTMMNGSDIWSETGFIRCYYCYYYCDEPSHLAVCLLYRISR